MMGIPFNAVHFQLLKSVAKHVIKISDGLKTIPFSELYNFSDIVPGERGTHVQCIWRQQVTVITGADQKGYLTWIHLTLSNERTTVDQDDQETKGKYSHVEPFSLTELGMSLKLQEMTTEHHWRPSLPSALDSKVMDSPYASTKAKL